MFLLLRFEEVLVIFQFQKISESPLIDTFDELELSFDFEM